MNYYNVLVETYDKRKDSLCDYPYESRFQFISRYIFKFRTHNKELDESFGRKAMEVFKAITEQNIYEYVKDKNNYLNYIFIINLPFFKENTEQENSIFEATWDSYHPFLDAIVFYHDGKEIGPVWFDNDTMWHKFTYHLINFAEEEINT